MTNPATIPSAGAYDTITVAPGVRIPFLADFSRKNRGAHARLEVLGPDVGYQVETENRPFDRIVHDVKDCEMRFGLSLVRRWTGSHTLRLRCHSHPCSPGLRCS